ncbi:olfactory receptor 51G2-like [Emydura macquarii macquarii]|uniref:olfactory receptor 51G2-like n=1 Tax=Emydura macquarii macquarii TaxID=1129001 RepID=UPI00352B48E0
MPTTLGIFWFNSREISHDACFAQLFFISLLSFTGSSMLLAFDHLYRYCQANILSHSYCLQQEVMKMAYSDIIFNIIYGFFLKVSSVGFDLLLILLSYVMILKTVLSIASHVARRKALNTCVSHICIMLLFNMPLISLSVIYRYSKNFSPLVQIVMAHVYLLVPPLMSPIVYSVKTKPICARIIRVFIK